MLVSREFARSAFRSTLARQLIENDMVPNEVKISLARLSEALSYDPDTGHFTWLIEGAAKGGGGRMWPGKRAGSLKPSGYICIDVDGVRYRAHRLAWLFMTGKPSAAQIDHANGDRSDNRWANLREATQRQNSANMLRKNKLGVKGVHEYRNPRTGIVRFRASIMVDGKAIYLGSHETIEQASNAYRAAAEVYFGRFARAA